MIGIYGGTFDPVHFGHLRPALDVYSLLKLSKIRFIPCGVPAHRNAPVANGQQRLDMLTLALQRQANFIVDDREVNRSGASFMVDTITSLIKDFADEKFCLIIGMDAFVKLDTWKDWKTITKLVSLVITQRPKFAPSSIPSSDLIQYMDEKRVNDKALFLDSQQTQCFFCPVTQLDISATNIRDLVRAGSDVNYLMPEKVVNYIQENNLYR